jgi:hypothetical protein
VIVESVSVSGVGTTMTVEAFVATTTEAPEGGGPLIQEVLPLLTMNGKVSGVVVDGILAGESDTGLQISEAGAVMVVGT